MSHEQQHHNPPTNFALLIFCRLKLEKRIIKRYATLLNGHRNLVFCNYVFQISSFLYLF